MIKEFYLTHRLDPINCYHSGQSGPGSNGNEVYLHSPKLEDLNFTIRLVTVISSRLAEGRSSSVMRSAYSKSVTK